MNLDEALAVWAYMKHQINPGDEAKAAADEAWKVICREANKVIYPAGPVPNGHQGGEA